MGWFMLGTLFGIFLMCCIIAGKRADEQMQEEAKKEAKRKAKEEKAKRDEENKKGK